MIYNLLHWHMTQSACINHHQRWLEVEYDGPHWGPLLCVFEWLKRPILEPQTFLQCGNWCEELEVEGGRDFLVGLLSFLCCRSTLAAYQRSSSWNVPPSCKMSLHAVLLRMSSSQLKLFMWNLLKLTLLLSLKRFFWPPSSCWPAFSSE